jgi:hypothetical protein
MAAVVTRTAGDPTAAAILMAVVAAFTRASPTIAAAVTLAEQVVTAGFRARIDRLARHRVTRLGRIPRGNPQTLDMVAAAGRVPTGLPLDGRIRAPGLDAVRARLRVGETPRGLVLRSERTGRQVFSKA